MTTEREDWTGTTGSSARFRTFDHTADVGIEVRAETLDELLAGGLQGMTELILGEMRPEPTRTLTVESEGEDPADLLRNLLREALYLHEAEGFAVAQAEVAVEGGGDAGLLARARLSGGPDPAPPDRELKGVTLHGLRADAVEDGWIARVIFDV